MKNFQKNLQNGRSRKKKKKEKEKKKVVTELRTQHAIFMFPNTIIISRLPFREWARRYFSSNNGKPREI